MDRFPNLIIRASAGSGKTYRLSNRYLMLLLNSVSADRILATTFSRKAAGEILDRILLRLGKAALNEKECSELSSQLYSDTNFLQLAQVRQVLAAAIRNIHRLRVCTLDSFFMKIVGNFTLELGLPIGWKIEEEVELTRILREAVQQTFRKMERTPSRPALALLNLFFKGEIGRPVAKELCSLAKELFDIWVQTEPTAWEKLPFKKISDPNKYGKALQQLINAPLPQTQKGLDNNRFVTARKKLEDAASFEDWKTFVSSTLVRAVRESGFFAKINLSENAQELVQAIEGLLECAEIVLINRLAGQTLATRAILEQVYFSVDRIKRQEKSYFFSDITNLLARTELMPHRNQLVHRLDAETDFLLLDEFQDTSFSQWKILEPIAKRIIGETDGSFFCVGDVKQAIYGWRGGIAKIVDSVAAIDGVQTESLLNNWRSSPVIIDAVNQIFSDLVKNPILSPKSDQKDDEYSKRLLKATMDGAENWQKRFETHQSADKNIGLSGCVTFEVAPLFNKETKEIERYPENVELYNSFEERETPQTVNRNNSQQHLLAESIEKTDLKSNLKTLFDKEEGLEVSEQSSVLNCTDNIADESVKTNNSQEDSDFLFDDSFVFKSDESEESEGNDKGSNGSESEQKQVTLNYAVKRIIEIHRRLPNAEIGVLLRTNDLIGQLVSALRRCGVDASEEGGTRLDIAASVEAILSIFTLADHPGDTVALFHLATVPVLSEFFGISEKNYSEEDRGGRISFWLRQELITRGLPELVAQFASLLVPYCDEREEERLERLLELACRYQSKSGCRLDEFIDAVRSSKVAAPGGSRIRVMTIHKSKGLEFDVVILPELDKSIEGTKVKNPTLVTHRPTPVSRIDTVFRGANQDEQFFLSDELKEYINEYWSAQYEESLSGLYVAVTRPVRQLVLISSPTMKDTYTSKTWGNILRAALVDGDTKNGVDFWHKDGSRTLYRSGDINWWRNEHKLMADPPKPKRNPLLNPENCTLQYVQLVLRSDSQQTKDSSEAENSLQIIDFNKEIYSEPDELNLKLGLEPDLAESVRQLPPSAKSKREWLSPNRFQRGTALHRCFEEIEWLDRNGLPDRAKLRAILRPIFLDVRKIEETLDLFFKMLEKPEIRSLLSLSSYQTRGRAAANPQMPGANWQWKVERERRYSSLLSNGQATSGCIDRLVLLYDGDRVVGADIIDYKSDDFRNDLFKNSESQQVLSNTDVSNTKAGSIETFSDKPLKINSNSKKSKKVSDKQLLFDFESLDNIDGLDKDCVATEFNAEAKLKNVDKTKNINKTGVSGCLDSSENLGVIGNSVNSEFLEDRRKMDNTVDEESINQRSEVYRRQLEEYQKQVMRWYSLSKKDVSCRIAFVSIGKIIEYS